jgi:phosphate transport system permease protein
MALTVDPGPTTKEAVRRAISGQKKDVGGTVFSIAMLACLLFSLLVLIVLMYSILVEALPVFENRGTDFLTSGLASSPEESGVWQGIYGSFFIAAIVALLAFPVGVAAAIYLEEYSSQNRIARFIQINIRNLAGVPSVVYGILGLIIFVKGLRSLTGGNTVIAAGLTLATLVLPIVIITAAEAIRAVPQELREAGYGVGATRWEVTKDHVLPYAAPGILTGTVLALARALGEAAPLILIGAVTGLLADTGLRERFTALPMIIFNWAGRPSVEGREVDWPNVTAAAIVVLLVVVLLANTAAVLLRNYYEKKR